jgi:hypothetical protein
VTYDGATWGALACSLSALGGVLTYVAWQRRGATALIRGAAWTLLPIAAWLTGTLKLLTEVLGDVGDWAVDLVFSPKVWLGICLAGVSAVLFGVSGFVRRRREPAKPVKPARSARAGRRGGALSAARGAGSDKDGPDGLEGLEGMDEIDAILRKHGIS